MPPTTGVEGTYTAAQFHIHTSSEHTIDGKFFGAEMHIVHFNDEGTLAAVLGTMIDPAAAAGNEGFNPALWGCMSAFNAQEEACNQECDLYDVSGGDPSAAIDPLRPLRRQVLPLPGWSHYASVHRDRLVEPRFAADDGQRRSVPSRHEDLALLPRLGLPEGYRCLRWKHLSPDSRDQWPRDQAHLSGYRLSFPSLGSK